MTLALWCVLIAGLLPYVAVSFAKSGKGYDNNDPRGYAASLEGRARRANAAHLNHFEAFPYFAAAVIVAELKGSAGTTVNALAVVFIVARLAYTAFYLSDLAPARSTAWFIGLIATLAIFTSPVWR